MDSPWTDERKAELKKLWEQGYSSSLIASRFGMSRSAIMGAVRRLNLLGLNSRTTRFAKPSGRPTPSEQPQKQDQPQKQEVKKARVMRDWFGGHVSQPLQLPSHTETDPAIKPKYIPLSQLTSKTCRYPYGDGPFLFCGCDIAAWPYCAPHKLRTTGHGTASERAAGRVLERAAA